MKSYYICTTYNCEIHAPPHTSTEDKCPKCRKNHYEPAPAPVAVPVVVLAPVVDEVEVEEAEDLPPPPKAAPAKAEKKTKKSIFSRKKN